MMCVVEGVLVWRTIYAFILLPITVPLARLIIQVFMELLKKYKVIYLNKRALSLNKDKRIFSFKGDNVERPNVDIYFQIKIFSILSIIGLLFAIYFWLMSKRIILLIIGLIGNGFVLAFTFFLLLAMGISEP